MEINKLNIFSQASALQGISPAQATKSGAGAASSNSSSNNPFSNNGNYGVGNVNSSLSNLSYRLPNGKQTNCNTIGIA